MTSIRLKRVLITGAAHGIGKAIAERFAKEGAELVLLDLNAENLEKTQAEFEQRGIRAWAYQADVTDIDSILAVREALHQDAGTIDILVNNAGVVFGGAFLDIPLEQHHLTYRVNSEGPVNMTYAFLPDLLAAPRGHLVNIASASGFIGLPNGTTYASSKWAAIGFSESIRLELKSQGHKNVDVTTVCPTFVNTGMFDGVKPPKTTRMLSPQEIADEVVKAVEERKIWVLEPFLVKITPFLKNCLPTGVGDWLSDVFGANDSMQTWKGHTAEKGN